MRFPGGSDGKESACNAVDLGSIPGLGRSPGEGNGCPLQYSCSENSMNRGAWRATVHGVAKSRTRLSLHAYHDIELLNYVTLDNLPHHSVSISSHLKWDKQHLQCKVTGKIDLPDNGWPLSSSKKSSQLMQGSESRHNLFFAYSSQTPGWKLSFPIAISETYSGSSYKPSSPRNSS